MVCGGGRGINVRGGVGERGYMGKVRWYWCGNVAFRTSGVSAASELLGKTGTCQRLSWELQPKVPLQKLKSLRI